MAPKPKSTEERFWAKVDRYGPVVRAELGPCWTWMGGKSGGGYGYFTFSVTSPRRGMVAHRAAWILSNGEIDDRTLCCHKCDNPSCVNPAHIFLGTQLDNRRDCASKGRAANGDRNGARLNPETRRGENNGNAKLTVESVREIRTATGAPLNDLATRFGVSCALVSRIRLGKAWRHVQ